MTMVRQTKQRAAVIRVLQHSRTHPDAAGTAWLAQQMEASSDLVAVLRRR